MPQPAIPRLWIVAGPNGSGKSTLYESSDIEGFGRSVWIINPDALSVRISEQEHKTLAVANAEALNRIQKWLGASVRAHQTVGVETVLSTPKYRTLVRLAKGFGFEVRLLYVCLNSPELNVERVRLRVAKGGHAVPEKKIFGRYGRSFKQLPWFLRHADFAVIFDNSGATPTVVGRKSAELIEIDPSAPDVVKNTVAKIRR